MATKSKAIVKQPEQELEQYEVSDVVKLIPKINGVFKKMAAILSQETVEIPVLASTMRVIREMKSTLTKGSGLETTAREKIITLVKAQGRKVTDKGSMLLEVDGWKLPIRVHKSGLDGKKVEAQLRQIDEALVEKFMVRTISYSMPAGTDPRSAKLAAFLDDKGLTEQCTVDESWAVETPEPVVD